MPASLRYRNLAVHCVTAACHLIGVDEAEMTSSDGSRLELSRDFDASFLSAFSEIFNNIVIHAYERSGEGEIRLELTPFADRLVVTIHDGGKAFDIDSIPPPQLDTLPEGGMGIHIARSCLDELDYTPGPPNRWRLIKYLHKGFLRKEGEN